MTTVRLPGVADAAGPERERRLRRALAWYPRDWRAQHGEAMLGVLLDVVEAEGMPGPSLPQRIDLAAHGLWQQLVSLANPRVRSLAAASALFGASAFALFDFVIFAWQPWVAYRSGGFLDSPAAWPDLAWLAGAALLLIGWPRVSRAVLAATGVGGALLPLIATPGSPLDPYGFTTVDGTVAWHSSTAVFVVAAVFALSGEVRAPRHPALLVPAAIAAAAAIFGVFGAVSFQMVGFRLNQQANGATGWDESSLWGGFDARALAEAVLVLPVIAALIWALARLGRRALAAQLTAVALPWLAFWVFHLVRDLFLDSTFATLYLDGRVLSFAGLSITARTVLLVAFVIGCLAVTAVGAWAVAAARLEAHEAAHLRLQPVTGAAA